LIADMTLPPNAMCGRISRTSPREALAEEFGVQKDNDTKTWPLPSA
jgi:hypothetical protein